jgi:hypothetical protein
MAIGSLDKSFKAIEMMVNSRKILEYLLLIVSFSRFLKVRLDN